MNIPWRMAPEHIEAALQQVLPLPDKHIAPEHARLLRAMRSAVSGGGKRLRFQLVIEAGHAAATQAGSTPAADTLLRAAGAIELIHAYSLVHDDLPSMDDADTRRGQPACHKEFGEATAILVGDALLTLAFETLAHAGSTPDRSNSDRSNSDRSTPDVDAGRVLRAMAILARAAGEAGMVGGQMIDIAWSNPRENDEQNAQPVSGAQLLQMHALKTGALIRAACEVGAVLGGGAAQTIENLAHYGAQIGRAFQLKDDLLDVEGDPEIMGKSASDVANDKITAPAFFGVEETRRLTFAARDSALSALESFGDEADALRALAHFVAEREK
jgi:geranylgeranyl pyrophosphate synthase